MSSESCPVSRNWRIVVGILFAAAVLVPVAIASWGDVSRNCGLSRQVRYWAEQGDQAFQKGETGLAIQAYRRALSLQAHRKDIADAIARARVHELAWHPDGLRTVDMDEVALDLAVVEKAFPKDLATVTALRGFMASAQGRIPEGQGLYKKALELDSGNGPAHLGLALLARRDPSRLAEAISELEAVVQAGPNRPDLRALLARTQLDRGMAAEALKNYEAAVEKKQEASWLKDLGQAALMTGDVNRAVQALTDSSRLQGQDPETWSLLAQAYLSGKAYDKAEQAARTSLSIQESPSAAYRLAVALNSQQKFQEALPLLQRLVSQGNEILNYYEYGVALAGTGRTQDAVRVFQGIVQSKLPEDQAVARVVQQIQAQAQRRIEDLQAAGK
ncbi:tetratricopeptide repeat protein [Myxococcota bacterium]|nr:tetratricopeptide repeat protein [Myxococcota bacterium]